MMSADDTITTVYYFDGLEWQAAEIRRHARDGLWEVSEHLPDKLE